MSQMSVAPPPAPLAPSVSRRRRVAAWVACAVLLATFALLAWAAVTTKSPTYDEPMHATAAWMHLRHFDFQANPEHPPLWKYWAVLPWLTNPPRADAHPREWEQVSRDRDAQWSWAIATLFHTPGNDPGKLIAEARAMMLVWGVALGVLIAWWGWRAGGSAAAVVACAMFALDPNFLAHSALVTNDVASALIVTAVGFVTWRIGQRATWPRQVGLALLCAAALATKFTGILVGPVVAVLLLIRALMPWPWVFLGRTIDRRGRRVAAAVVACVALAACGYVGLWGAYGFRFRAAADPSVQLEMRSFIATALANEVRAVTGNPNPTPQQVQAWQPSAYLRALLTVRKHHLLPEAFVDGMLYAYGKSLYRSAFLLGQISPTGWWYYFPVAMAVKTPLTTLAAVLVAIVLLVLMPGLRRATERSDDATDATGGAADPTFGPWLWLCLAVPVAVLGWAAIRSNLNIGVRHVLTLYPFAFVAIGVVAQRLYERFPHRVAAAGLAAVVLLAAETLSAFPDYIPFFNAAAGGSRGGIELLSDSNLDWGQDLPALARWQQRHPADTLFLLYFGTADPAYYGIRYRPIVPGAGDHGFFAVSATNLQGVYLAPAQRDVLDALLRRCQLVDVLGGSIYVYRLP